MRSLYLIIFFILSLFIISCADASGSSISCTSTSCEADEICNETTGKCEFPKRCTETGCENDKVCNELTGLCETASTCLDTGCSNTQYCDPVSKECKENCYEGKCQDNETCDSLTALCEPDCSKVTCQDNFKCDTTDALCKAKCLSTGSCEVTEQCNITTGLCELNCFEGKCAANESCVPLTGECKVDCSQVTCQGDSQLCDPSDGVCKPICEVNVCEEKQYCNQTTGLCEETILSQYQNECEENTDCLSALCIEVGDSKQCSLKCEMLDGCGENWNCFPYNEQSICAPILNYSCDTCTEDADCSLFGGKCLEIDAVKSCLDSCKFSDNCNTGFSCEDTDIDGDIFKLCSPSGNSCDCNSDNIDLTLNCDITNGLGTCQGDKVCTESGWSGCSGEEASEEICDNKDNNCDGIIDNTILIACDNSNDFGICNGELTCINGIESCSARIPQPEICNGIDDNCDNNTDDGLEDLGCRKTNEIGSCEGFQICGGENGWEECNALEPSVEICDGVDNNCNGSIDEDLATDCEIDNEFGLCLGTRTCLGESGWDDCNAQVPVLEVCDGIDNNCNTEIDEASENLFDNCSQMVNAELSCVTGSCILGACEENYWNIDNDDSNGCEYACTADSIYQDIPDGIDHNCDGIDGLISDAYFVSSRIGNDNNNTGTMTSPFKTISHALSRAKILGLKQVIVATGDYNEALNIANDGVSIFGGYNDITWQRDFSNNISKILLGITCSDITQETIIDGFTIHANPNIIYPQNSIAINIISSGNNLKLQNLIINSGNGLIGTIGANGSNGANGGSGSVGQPGSDNDDTKINEGGAGGINNSCSNANGGQGGQGGKENHQTGYNGISSSAGITGGLGGAKGDPGHTGGVGGSSSLNGTDGADGLGATSSGNINLGVWIGISGNSGNSGIYGAGGGGGGGGGAQDVYYTYYDGSGAGGGGGSAGGCGASGGHGGLSGTGSFGIFMLNSSPTLSNINVKAGFGGAGGAGGNGGSGGTPGLNVGAGGNGGGESGSGGAGGAGKSGGNGGAGGGGAGGVSYCIYRANSTPTLNSWTCTTSLGGTGGYSSGYSGATGDSGDIY